MSEPGACIVVQRVPAPWRDERRAYKVRIDGQVVGKIRSGEEHRYEVSPGEHTLDLRIDWKGSTALSVALQSGDSATFACEPGGGAVTASVDLVRDRPWVSLRRVG